MPAPRRAGNTQRVTERAAAGHAGPDVRSPDRRVRQAQGGNRPGHDPLSSRGPGDRGLTPGSPQGRAHEEDSHRRGGRRHNGKGLRSGAAGEPPRPAAGGPHERAPNARSRSCCAPRWGKPGLPFDEPYPMPPGRRELVMREEAGRDTPEPTRRPDTTNLRSRIQPAQRDADYPDLRGDSQQSIPASESTELGGYRTSVLSRLSQRVTVIAVTGHSVMPRLRRLR